jgi:hypothetical protein
MKTFNAPPLNLLFEVFDVDFSTGQLFWKVKIARQTKIGDLIGVKRPSGHVFVQLKGKNIAVHRIIWAMKHGEWPNGMIDHINQNPADNRPENLRIVTKRQNAANVSKPYKTNKIGLKGVTFRRKVGKYVASIRNNGRQEHLGFFATAEDAAQAYIAAHSRIHGEFSPFVGRGG